MKTSFAALAAAAALGLASAAQAQTSQAQASQAAPYDPILAPNPATSEPAGNSSAPPPASIPAPLSSHGYDPEAAPTPRQLELARQVVATAHLASQIHLALQSFGTAFAGTFDASASSTRLADAAEAATSREFDKITPRIVNSIADIYARNFTEAELNGLLLFYQSPTGHAVLAKTPLIAAQTQAALRPLLPAMQRNVAMDICDSLACSPEKRQAVLSHFPKATDEK